MFLELNKVFPELRNTSPEARLLSEVSNKELFLDDQPEELLGHRCELVQTRSIQCKTRHPNSSHSQTWGPFPHPCCWIKSYQIVEFFLPRSKTQSLVNRPIDGLVQVATGRVKTSKFQTDWKHRNCYTKTPLHREDFTQSSFETQTPGLHTETFYTQKLWHRHVFTPTSFYTEQLLNTDGPSVSRQYHPCSNIQTCAANTNSSVWQPREFQPEGHRRCAKLYD